MIPGIFVSPLVGLFTDRLGRRRVLLSSLVLWSLAGGGIALAPPFWLVLALRLVQGIALAGLGITTITLISDVFEGVQRNAVFGVNTAVLSVGAAAFPVVGGALVTVSWNAPFAMFLLGLPVALFALIVLDEPVGERESGSSTYVRRVISALSVREALVFYGSALLIDLLLFGAVFTALPFLLEANFGFSALSIGLVLTVGEAASIVAATQNGRLSQHYTDPEIIAVGFMTTALGLGGVWFATSPVLIAISTVGFGAGWGLTLPSIDAGVSDLVRTQYRAGALSLRGSASSIGRAGGPIAFTTLSLQFDYRVLLLSAGIIALGFGVLIFVLD